jgi:hypothetical protein
MATTLHRTLRAGFLQQSQKELEKFPRMVNIFLIPIAGGIMGNTVTVYVPPSRDVVIKGFTNAAYLQRITLNTEGMGQTVIGTGENNTLIGTAHFTTPSKGDPNQQVPIDVTIEYSADDGATWKAPQIYSNSCSVQAYNLTVLAAEDSLDQDFNDVIWMISWPGRVSQAAGIFADH